MVGFYLDSNTFVCTEMPVVNCSFYDQDNSICVSCVDGFSILFENNTNTCVPMSHFEELEAANPRFYPGYIETCDLDATCADVYMGGIPPIYSQLYSCHVCADTTKIPFVSIRGFDTNIPSLDIRGL